MKRLALAFAVSALAFVPLRAQDLSGTYSYDSGQGVVTLELQHSGTQVSGVMRGIDGSVNRLDGVFDGGSATGSIQTRNGSGWFAAELDGSSLTLIVAALDPSTGQPDVSNGWQLDFTRTGAASAGARGASSSSTGGRNVAQPSPSSPMVREWMAHLSGKKVTYIDSYDSGGGSGGFSDRWEAYLCSDGSFHFRSSSSMSADVGGVYGGSNSSDSFSGSWRVVEHNGEALLQYQRAEQAGTEQGQWISLGYQNGETYFDGSRVYVTADNPMCR